MAAKIDISKRIRDVLEGMDDRNRYFLFAGLLLFVLIIYYIIFMQPHVSALIKLSSQIRLKSDNINRAEANIRRLPDYRAEAERLRNSINLATTGIKAKEDLHLVTEYISMVAEDNNVRIEQITGDSNSAEVLLESGRRRYLSVPVLIQASAGYHDFGRFLAKIEGGDILLKVNSFSITSMQGSPDKHNIILTLFAVVYEEV